MTKSTSKVVPRLELPDSFTNLIVHGLGVEVEFIDGRVVVHSGNVKLEGNAKLCHEASPTSPTSLKIGDAIADGPNAGWVYCETANKTPFLVSPFRPDDGGVMLWRDAMAFADRKNRELPTKDELQAMYEHRNAGDLRGTFDISGSNPGGWYWSSAQLDGTLSWCQRFSDGTVCYEGKNARASIRCVRRYAIT